MKYLLILIATIFILINTVYFYAQDNRWVLYYNNEFTEYYIDNETISYQDKYVYIWEKQIPLSLSKDANGNINYSLLKIKINCTELSYEVLSITTYYSNGTYIDDDNLSDKFYAKPNSLREKTIKFVCK
ncbi:MAG: hypothetical protein J0M37_15530 [Ignavibacteria bacterium]|nr:hypothetical protein [Ignavibacteria bacterium]